MFSTNEDRKSTKIKGFRNVFGIYDHTNDQMYTYSYKNKTRDQFLDFIKRVDRKYDFSVCQANISYWIMHQYRSKKVRETIQKYHHRQNKLCILANKIFRTELNLIEVRWLWMQRQAINNSTFKNEPDIGKAVSDWTYNYNEKHGRRITG